MGYTLDAIKTALVQKFGEKALGTNRIKFNNQNQLFTNGSNRCSSSFWVRTTPQMRHLTAIGREIYRLF
jgi:hypothetical protein